jgi:hypothetical protein
VNIYHTANIWKETGAKLVINTLPKVDNDVLHCVVSCEHVGELCNVVSEYQCCGGTISLDLQVMEGSALSQPVQFYYSYWTRKGAAVSPALSNHIFTLLT